jgi:membrane protein YdbS with pleckstrin-like domain
VNAPSLSPAAAHTQAELRQVLAIERPHPNLMTYYVLTSLLAGPFFILLLVYLYFRYHTMRYRFDEHGVSMRWGILFRREVNLAYARIQDIHLTSNLVERWLGLAEVKISTASGSAAAEMIIEERQDYELIRDFLYARMRAIRDLVSERMKKARGAGLGDPEDALPPGGGPLPPDLAAAARELAAESSRLRAAVARGLE